MPRPGRRRLNTFVWKRAHTIAAAVTAVVLVGGGIGLATTLGRPPAPDSSPSANAASSPTGTTPAPPTTDSPTTKPQAPPVDPLTGGKPSKHPVIAAKIENIAAARPQVGISAADIVFAEEVEGAQTRLIAIYHTNFPTRIGPVRSARSTDVQLLPLFGKPGLVYSGANTRVQRKIDNASIVAISRSTRDNRRVAPHNVFVDLAQIARRAKAKPARSIGWQFSAAKPSGARETKINSSVGHDRFTFAYGKGRYVVRWNGNRYADGDSGRLTRVDNVVIMKVRNHGDGNRDVLGAPSVQSDTVGHGKVTIHRDGTKITGTWRRTKVSGPLRFADSDGKNISLKPGQTWVLLRG